MLPPLLLLGFVRPPPRLGFFDPPMLYVEEGWAEALEYDGVKNNFWSMTTIFYCPDSKIYHQNRFLMTWSWISFVSGSIVVD